VLTTSTAHGQFLHCVNHLVLQQQEGLAAASAEADRVQQQEQQLAGKQGMQYIQQQFAPWTLRFSEEPLACEWLALNSNSITMGIGVSKSQLLCACANIDFICLVML
jgi:hypothetical protein